MNRPKSDEIRHAHRPGVGFSQQPICFRKFRKAKRLRKGEISIDDAREFMNMMDNSHHSSSFHRSRDSIMTTYTGKEMAAKMRDGEFDTVETFATLPTFNDKGNAKEPRQQLASSFQRLLLAANLAKQDFILLVKPKTKLSLS